MKKSEKHLLAAAAGVGLLILLTRGKTAKASTLAQEGEAILADPSNLEGYFSTGATPCCTNCATKSGRCSG